MMLSKEQQRWSRFNFFSFSFLIFKVTQKVFPHKLKEKVVTETTLPDCGFMVWRRSQSVNEALGFCSFYSSTKIQWEQSRDAVHKVPLCVSGSGRPLRVTPLFTQIQEVNRPLGARMSHWGTNTWCCCYCGGGHAAGWKWKTIRFILSDWSTVMHRCSVMPVHSQSACCGDRASHGSRRHIMYR